jgi:hypothetical protein
MMDDAPRRISGIHSRRAWGLVALARRRLRRAAGGRLGAVVPWLVAAGFAGVAVALRVADGGDAPLGGLVASAARWLAWLAGAPVALAAAEDRRALDRRDGIDALVGPRGFSDRAVESARVLGAMIEVARAIGAPLVAIALVALSLSGSGAAALGRIGLALGAALCAAVAGVTLGGVAAACGRLGRARGRWLLAAVILGPWAIADLGGHGSWSIPGALGAMITFTLGGAGA